MVRFGSRKPKDFFIGQRRVKELWLGQKRVWPEEKQLQWIQSSGSQMAIVRFPWTAQTKVQVSWQRVDRATQSVFGSRSVNNASVGVQLRQDRNNDNLSRLAWLNYSATALYSPWISGANLQQRAETCTIDYQTMTMSGTAGSATLQSLVASQARPFVGLFGVCDTAGAGAYSCSTLRIMSFKAWSGDELLHDLVPWMKDGKGCFKDLVDGSYSFSITSTDFICGPEA